MTFIVDTAGTIRSCDSQVNAGNLRPFRVLAHEFRSPLHAIRNALQVMKRGADDDPHASEQARMLIERQVKQLARLVDDLLDPASLSEGRLPVCKERTDLVAIVRMAVETCQPILAAAGCTLSERLPAGEVYAYGDPGRLTQVLINLIDNAAKYTGCFGQIELTVEREGEQLLIRVQDDGVGIPANVIPHVFELFVQARHLPESWRNGFGVGLALVKQIVELHGGTVEARSAGLGLGSVFVVRLPGA